VRTLKLLWVDMTVESSAPEVPAEFADHCNVIRATARQSTAQQLRHVRPDAVIFDFDYPDKNSLTAAAQLKEDHASVPMVLLSVQHSEALAVWAFRTRFFDFLVRPVVTPDVERWLTLLEEVAAERRAQPHRHAPFISVPMPAEVPAAVSSARSLQPAVDFIQCNVGAKIVAEDMAKLCLMSPFRFSRAFREAFGVTFREFIVQTRLIEAARLLENPQVPVTQVAYAVGFNDMSHFSRMFKREFGVTPSAAQASFQGGRQLAMGTVAARRPLPPDQLGSLPAGEPARRRQPAREGPAQTTR
jgi:AraC-like DNA-binding protein